MNTLGQTVKKLRSEKALTQPDLGKLVGVSGKQIGAIESGRTLPSLEVLIRLAEVFRCSLDQLALGRDPSQLSTGKSFDRAVLDRQLDQLTDGDLRVLLATAKALGERKA